MPFLRLAVPALLLALCGAAWAQTAQPVAPGSLPPPRPVQPAAPSSGSPPAAPRPPATPPPQGQGQGQGQGQAAPRPQGQTQGQTQRQAPRPPTQSAPRPQGQTQGQQARPSQGQGSTPTVGNQRAPQNRRAPAAAAGAAAGAAAAGAAAAANRAPEPAQPAAPAGPPPLPPPSTGSVSGLPIPRFASLRSDQVNMRVGPNTTFPIEWTFQRRDLPVMIVGEFQVWRRIRDVDGAEGWVHQSTLAGRRTVLVKPPGAADEIVLRRRGEDGATPVARMRPGVIARIRECEPASAWCEVQVQGMRGFVKRAEVWGLLPDEEVK
jgi:SH3-like domain-containing protein